VEEKILENLEIYRVHPYLYRIEDEDFNSLVAKYQSSKPVGYKHVIRKEIIKKLNLSRLDTIFFTDSSLYIKLFIKLQEQSEQERRACGLNQDELEEFKRFYFPNGEYKEISMWLLEFVVDDILSFKKITPYEFKNIFLIVFINMMELIVIENCDFSDEKSLKGFSLYLLREMFDHFLLYISETILYAFSNQDKKAIEFLSCFSVNETIDSKGVRYKANPILDESNHAWNITTIRSTLLQHKRAKEAIYDKKNALLHSKKKLQELELDLKNLELKRVEKLEKINEIEEKREKLHQNIDRVKEATTKTVKYKEGDVESTYSKQQLIAKLYRKDDDLLKVKKEILREIKDLELKIANKKRDVVMWEKRVKDSQKNLQNTQQTELPIDKQFERIKKALAKTLARR